MHYEAVIRQGSVVAESEELGMIVVWNLSNIFYVWDILDRNNLLPVDTFVFNVKSLNDAKKVSKEYLNDLLYEVTHANIVA